MSTKVVWIGLVQVLSLPESQVLQDVSGAYVNVLTWASSSHEFKEKATELMDYLGLKLVGVEGVEPLSKREESGALGADIEQVVAEMQDNPHSVRYMTFHAWTEVNS